MRPGRQFCNYLILTMCDPDILDINCVRSCLGLEPVCDLVTTLPAFLQSLLFLLNVLVLSPPDLLLANPHSIGSFSRTLYPLLRDSSMLFMAFYKKLSRVFWSAVGSSSSSEKSERIEMVLVLIISLRCIPKNV